MKVFLIHMGESYESKGIRLMETDDINDFMRLLMNLRGGITQIVKRHARMAMPSSNTEQATASKEGIYHLDANNLYGGAMHRILPYELVGVPEREELMEKINYDPNRWVQSLKTFDNYMFFIECDIEEQVKLHDKFNDLPFILFDTEGRHVFRWNQEIC